MNLFDINKFWNQFVYDPKNPIQFNTGLFVFLFLAFYSGYLLLRNKHRGRIIYVILFSWFFYYKSSGIYFLILVGSTIVDFYLADQIVTVKTKSQKKFYLILSLVLNLGMLAYFKYTNSFIELGRELILNTRLSPYFNSAYFLQYFDLHFVAGNIKPLKSIIDYGFFVSFFPQLVAGPIVRAKDFLPQIHQKPLLTNEDLGKALFLIMTGLIKKAVISDYISSNFVDRVFDNPLLYSGFENLMATYGYAMQIYCDFSGYSDMAIGIALLLGFKLPQNFNAPYISANVTEFWRRWHISLSSWLRDYLYIPLGGNRKGKFRTYLNLMITMSLGGLWHIVHGQALKFFIWGALHGAALSIEKAFNSLVRIPPNRIIRFLSIILTFHFVCFCWIFFRASDFNIAKQVILQCLLFIKSFFLHFTVHIATTDR